MKKCLNIAQHSRLSPPKMSLRRKITCSTSFILVTFFKTTGNKAKISVDQDSNLERTQVHYFGSKQKEPVE